MALKLFDVMLLAEVLIVQMSGKRIKICIHATTICTLLVIFGNSLLGFTVVSPKNFIFRGIFLQNYHQFLWKISIILDLCICIAICYTCNLL